MDQEIMEGIVLSYTKILKEIKEIKEKIDSMLLQDRGRGAAGAPDAAHDVPGEERLGGRGKGRSARNRKNARKSTETAAPGAPGAAGGNHVVVSDFFKKLEDSI